ncbi:MAG: rRNA maturation RNase YbeY [Candidatus Rokubacteria bacterium]|nr:rRNA maturation RNase YbeY [Candidatus Rokubacteria bacterium]
MACSVENRQRRVTIPARRLAAAAARALAAVGRSGGALEILVVDDAGIRAVNTSYRGVRRRTDVIAFPLEIPQAAGGLVGQIVISAETAERQARRLAIPLGQELELLATHGVLHLVGYDDRDPVEADLMHCRERDILSVTSAPPARLWRGLLPGEGRRP